MQQASILFFILANGLAGLLNYYFQVSAARSLSDIEYGQFSAWFATVSGLMIVGAIAQYYANYSPRPQLKSLWLKGLALFLFLPIFLLVPKEQNLFLTGAGTILCSVLFGYLIGNFQREKMFFHFGAAGLFFALTRVLAVMAGESHLRAFLFSTWFSQALAALVVSFFLYPKRQGKSENIPFLGLSVLLAFFVIVMPNFDLAWLSRNHSAEEIAWLGRSLLPAKFLFFCGAILLQVLLPYQAGGEWIKFFRSKKAFYGVYFFTVIVFSAASEILLPRFFAENMRVIPQVIFLGSFNFSLLLLCQFELQGLQKAPLTKIYFFILATVVLAMILAGVSQDLSQYFLGTAIFRMALLAYLLGQPKKIIT